jgi:hypothetical protein
MVSPEIIQEIAKQVSEIVISKNALYGSSFEFSGAIIKVLYPDGVKPYQYTDFLAVVRIIDKLFRIANRKPNNGETESPWLDVTGYGLLLSARELVDEPESDE